MFECNVERHEARIERREGKFRPEGMLEFWQYHLLCCNSLLDLAVRWTRSCFRALLVGWEQGRSAGGGRDVGASEHSCSFLGSHRRKMQAFCSLPNHARRDV